MCFKNKTKAI